MKMSRRKFLKLGSLLIFSPLVLCSSFNCYRNNIVENSLENITPDQFNSLMFNQPKYEIGNHSLNKGERYLIPLSSIVLGKDGRNIGSVTCIRFQNGKVMYQSVTVKIIETVEPLAWVTNLEEGDIILENPRKTLIELRGIDIKELRSRFLPAKHLHEG